MASGRPPGLRLFVACPLPDEVREGLAAVQEDLRRRGARLRWVRAEGIHITLKFLGQVPATRLAPISEALRGAIEPFQARLRVERLGGFGGARLRVVWAGLGGDAAALAAQAGRVELALSPLGFPREQRPFAPHVTLARVPDETPAADRRHVAGLIEGFELPAIPSMTLTEVHLMRSTLGRAGAVYDTMAVFPAGDA